MAKTVDKLPEPKKDPPKPAAKAPAPAVAAPTKAPVGPSNGVAAAAPAKPTAPAKPGALPKKGDVARPTEVLELQGMTPFQPGAWGDYIKSFHGDAADVDVKWGRLAPKTTIQMKWDRDLSFITHSKTGQHAELPLDQPFFRGLPEKLAPSLFVKVRSDQVTGFAAPHATPFLSTLSNALEDPKITAAIGLTGFKLPSPKIQNEIKDGHFHFGADAIVFSIAGWVSGSLALGLVDDAISFDASAHIKARGIAEGDLHVTRDKDGNYTGQLQLGVAIGKASGNVLATYANGDITITGTIKYASDKFSGSLTVMFGDVNEVQKAARGQLDPGKVMEDEKVPDDGGGKEKTKKGEKGLAAWGEFAFAFTDWMTGTALGILDPFGHITIVGKINPPKSIELMKETGKAIAIPPFPFEITARYGLPYVADVHVGVEFNLGAVARIGPAVLTDIVVQGTYSTDPKILQDFSISGAFRISAYAGLNLSIAGKAGLTILKHDIDFLAKITGSAGVKAYAEARPTIGYRETADPLAGKKGEAYLQGHLEAAAQAVLGLAGDLEIRLSSPWWSPAPNKTWTWPLFSLEWPLGSGIGIGADIDYVIGSDKLPDVKLGKVDFDASKFMDSALDSELPQKSGGGDDKEKAGSWKGKEPPPPTAPPPEVAKKPAPGGTKGATAGTPKGKAGKGQQTHDEAANVPKTPDAAKRWAEGLKELADIHAHAEKSPESSNEIHAQLHDLKQKFGFSRLEASLVGDYWVIDAELNPRISDPSKKPKIKALKPGSKKTGTEGGSGEEKRIELGFPSLSRRPGYHWFLPDGADEPVVRRDPEREKDLPPLTYNKRARRFEEIPPTQVVPGSNTDKGFEGERRANLYMNGRGYSLLPQYVGKHTNAPGIDAVYDKHAGRPKYVVADAKYNTAKLKKGQLTREWAEARLEEELGNAKAREIMNTAWQRWVIYVPADKNAEPRHEVLDD